ncbi:MAG: hypothetical protein JNM36_17075 [Chitinophagales bacterium]|jgi:hypothetical protein|nr:hypothetical protein [Chitinophagales bacterium]
MKKIILRYYSIPLLVLFNTIVTFAQTTQQQLLQGNWQCIERTLVDDKQQPIEQQMNFENAELPMFPDNMKIEKQTINLFRLQNTLEATWQIDSSTLKVNTTDSNQTIAQFDIINISEEQLILALPKKDSGDAYSLHIVFKKKK